MFFVGYKGFIMMRNPPDNAMIIEATARQWAWEFSYPGEKVTSTEMYVPVNTPVKVLLKTPIGDVIHAFYLPDLRVKEDIIPGQETYVWFQAEREGTYDIFCAEYCGKDHSKMRSFLHVVSSEGYRAWVKKQIAKRYKPLVFEGVKDPKHPAFGPADLNIDAKKLFGTYCASCHGSAGDGSGLPGKARDFTSSKGWKNKANVSGIFKTLVEGIKDTQMRAYPNLTPWERVGLGHYVRSFQKGAVPADSEADFKALVKTYELDKIKGPGETIEVEKAMEILAREARETDEPAK